MYIREYVLFRFGMVKIGDTVETNQLYFVV